MKEIQLTQGFVTYISDDKYDLVIANGPWCYSGHGYAINSKHEYLHHIIKGKPPKGWTIDHIDNNGLNNVDENLRFSTHSENHINHKGLQSNNTTGFVGVSMSKGKFQAHMKIGGKKINLGTFLTAEEAAKSRDKAVIAHFGERAYLNFPL